MFQGLLLPALIYFSFKTYEYPCPKLHLILLSSWGKGTNYFVYYLVLRGVL